MTSEHDVQPLIENEERQSIHDQLEQNIHTDVDFEQVVRGYQKSRWRTFLVYFASTLCAGLPFLVFHWCPTWRLYATSVRCTFNVADAVLVIETYQKKCKSYYIHKILDKDIADTSGVNNEGFQEEEEEKPPMVEEAPTPVHLADGTKLLVPHYRYFRHKKCVLVWHAAAARWARLGGVECGASCHALQARGDTPPSCGARARMLNIYGRNEIQVQVQSVWRLIVLEVFNPFYIFQLFTIAVWLAEPYYYYCIAVVLMSTFGVATSVVQTKRNQQNLRATVESHDPITILVGNRREVTDSSQAVPGDILVLPANGCRLHCDAVLLCGSAILNESMLTGESVPVTKTALPRVDRLYSEKEHAAHTLFCGTSVIQTRYYNGEPVRALVLRTGYDTSKGQLVRSILYPTPADFKFDRDSYKFIIILAALASVGLAYTVALKAYRKLTPGDIAIKALDIITIVIPPALPAAMTVGRLYCVSRLERARITCLNTRAVNVSGSLDCICFDKTGTLTEDGLDMWGVVPCSPHTAPPSLGAARREAAALSDLQPLKMGMAACHSLTLLGGVLAGDPLDLKMFESTGWLLEEPPVPETGRYEVLTPTVVRPRRNTNINVDDFHVPLEVGVVHQNQFVSSLQRSSVAVKVLGEDVYRLFCKGAPEMLRTLCRPDTVPHDLDPVLSSYAEKGYRVIAMSTRVMETTYKELQRMTREEMECELEFLGLVILENRLKPATAGVIRELKEANIHVVMITGDNIHTAVSVARECGILQSGERVVRLYTRDEDKIPVVYAESTLHGVVVGRTSRLRLTDSVDSGCGSEPRGCDAEAPRAQYRIVTTGDTWRVLRTHYPTLIPRIISRGAVFARMTSDQKQQLIVDYQALGYYVGMCGDGANDCGALRAAHTGVSLSELESSVAAPFTARDPDIVCVARVLREGRAALTTSFGVFKFMVAYSLTEFISVAFLYYFDSNLTDFQFLFIDVALVVNFAFFFGHTEAFTGKLCSLPPLTSLLGLVPLFSLIGQMALIAVAQFASYYAVTQFPWYQRHTYEGEEENECWENYAIYAVSMFQYVIMALVFSHGAPYRRSVLTNRHLMISILIMTTICVYITISPAEWLAGFLQLRMPLDTLMGYIVLAIAGVHLAVAIVFERFVVQYMMEEREMIPKFLKEKRVRKTPHLLIQRQLSGADYLDSDDVISYDTEGNGRVTDSSASCSGKER